MAPGWLGTLATASVLLSTHDSLFASAFTHGNRIGGAPSYRGAQEICPSRCAEVGPDPSKWDVYQHLQQLQQCNQPMLYQFSTFDNVDDRQDTHQIFACSVIGSDWVNEPKKNVTALSANGGNTTVEYEIGWWTTVAGDELKMALLSKQMRMYLEAGNSASNSSTILYGRIGMAVAAMYHGQGVYQADIATSALRHLEDELRDPKTPRDNVALQLCGEKYASDHTFGFISVTNGTFTPLQDAIKTWSNSSCLEFAHSTKFHASTRFTTPLLSSVEDNGNATHGVNSTSRDSHLIRRGDCRTIVVRSGDSCAALASRCGISGHDFDKYNSASGFCAHLKPGQHVCCSSGDLPDFRPKSNKDGSCATARIDEGESCSTVAAANGLEIDDIESFNKKTWGWNGCKKVFAHTVVCVSKGSPPMPAPLNNAICGPQVPGTEAPKDKSDLAKLNPCPLNACCNIWGQCGTTKDFCIDTNTGAPGTAKPGTYGCISNCGMEIVRGDAPAEFRSIGYFEGFNFERKCLFQEPLQIDTDKYTHIHFGFGDISHDYEVSMGDVLNQYAFKRFKMVRGAKRIVSFGGWTFSTSPETYTIFREGTANADSRLKLAHNLANFVHDNDLDGIDIDWEYPSAPDIPGIPAGDKAEGLNYLKFLVILKNLIGDKSLSIAAPASYWYLKGFPIERISKVVDYIVYMTYDLHGQWDAGNAWSQPDCPTGQCLRSHVNLTETVSALVMITKAGVPSNKLVTGITSYGRSFAMADPSCRGPECGFTGSRLHSNAEKGKCTDTAGYLANAEIYDILKDEKRVNAHYKDGQSDSNILVYDNNNWVAYMDADIRARRTRIYKGMHMGGTVNWAIDLEGYFDPPSGIKSWGGVFIEAKSGLDPLGHPRHGNWTEIDCHNPYADDQDRRFDSDVRWSKLDSEDAWKDLVRDWKEFRETGRTDDDDTSAFSGQIGRYLMAGYESANCGSISVKNGCDPKDCDAFTKKDTSGAGGGLVWNSFAQINADYVNFYHAIANKAEFDIFPSLDKFEDKFAPVKSDDGNQWIDILISLVSLGAPMAVGGVFKNLASKLPALAEKAEKAEKWASTITSGVVGTAATFKKGDAQSWDLEGQHEFKSTIGHVLGGWQQALSTDLEKLFNGEDESLSRLGDLIEQGKAIGGSDSGLVKRDSSKEARDYVEPSLERAFYSVAIPALWKASGHYPAILQVGVGCRGEHTGGIKGLEYHCYKNQLYQLGVAGKECYGSNCDDEDWIKPPPGMDEIKDGKSEWGNLTWKDFIEGSVESWLQEKTSIDPKDQLSLREAAKGYVTTPGIISIPVCGKETAVYSAEIAHYKGSDVQGKPNYPCDVAHSLDYCGPSTFVDQTSDASPKVEDCLELIKELNDPTKYVEPGSRATVPFHGQKRFWSHKSCKFGAEPTGSHKGNSFQLVGAQDAIDVIHDSIKKFGGSGRVGSKGVMQCYGDLNSNSKVEWGLY